LKKKLLVAQSGGPTAVINSSLAGVVDYALKCGEFSGVIGSINGIEGVFNENFIDMEKFREDKRIKILKQTPSSYLGSCRRKLENNDCVYEEIFNIFDKHNIGAFVYIGGNDSMDTVNKLSFYASSHRKDVTVTGVPKTIDNDLVLTDHTPGYGSCAKYIANSIRQLFLDTAVYDMQSVIIAEIMGRNAGWLTAAAALANDGSVSPVDIICMPEVPFEIDKFLNKTAEVLKSKSSTIIAVSEGICDKNGNYVTAGLDDRSKDDGFAHAALGGVGRYVESFIKSELGVKTRTIEFSTLQRCNSETASLCDVEEAFRQGEYGAKLASEGVGGVMVGITRGDGEYNPTITSFPIGEIANKEKKMHETMLGADGFSVTDEYIKYASPLIAGQPEIIYKNGIMQFEIR